MNKRIIIRLALIMVGAIALLGTLMAITTMPNEKNNGFVRSWVSEDALEPIDTINLTEDLSGIAGISEHSIFLAGSSPTGILIVNKKTHKKDTLQISLELPPNKLVPFYLKIDTPNLFLHLNNMYVVIDGKFPNAPFRTTEITTGVFLSSIQLNDSIALIKTPDPTLQYQYLNMFNLKSKKITKTAILKDKNGFSLGLSNDGMLLFDQINQLIVYIEYYRNKIYSIDTNLNLKFESSTIDTVASLKLDLASQKNNDSTNKLTQSEARIIVNNSSSIYNGMLYVISELRADNQDIRQFNTHLNFDVYNLSRGEYSHSFQIEKQHEKKASSFTILNDSLYVMFNKEIRIFNLIRKN